MDYYDKLIHRALEALDGACETAIDPGEVLSWKQADGNPLALESESALELGRYPLPGVEFTMMSGSGLVDRDLIRIFGPDITDKKKFDGAFGKIILLGVREMEEGDGLYDQIKEIEHLKFKLYLDGYMNRASVEKHRENIRISRDAVKKGISFKRVGKSMIEHYKTCPNVEHVQVIFITEPLEAFSTLTGIAREGKKITDAMCTILDDLNFDCKTCKIKNICDEVGGLMDLHKKQKK